MKELSLAAHSLWAKKDRKGEAKWLPLPVHLSDSASVAENLWNTWVSNGVRSAITKGIGAEDEEAAKKLLVFLAAAHDIGKATPVFQAKPSGFLPSDMDNEIEERIVTSGLAMEPFSCFSSPGKSPHALATQLLLERSGCHKNVAVISGSHHGKPPDYAMLEQMIDSYDMNYYLNREGKPAWTNVQEELIAYALRRSGFASLKDLPTPDMPAQVLLSGLLIMIDWVASNEYYFPYYSTSQRRPTIDERKRARDAIKELDLPKPWQADNAWMRLDLYKERFGFDEPNAVQTALRTMFDDGEAPGIIVLEAPMGIGKTEAALVAAEILAQKTKRTGVFFALPTQATSNAIFSRIRKWTDRLSPDTNYSIKLAHGKAQFNKDYQTLFEGGSGIEYDGDSESSAIVHQWFEGNKKSLLADFVVGTIDQLLMAALKQKHVMLRHLGLANKVVIIDECHAYDAYMSRYLEIALAWLGAYNVPVIVLSATLPAQKRQMVINAYLNKRMSATQSDDPLGISNAAKAPIEAYIANRAYPLITYTKGNLIEQTSVALKKKPSKVTLSHLAQDALLDELEKRLDGGGCAGIIVNTVRHAQEIAALLIERFGEETVMLLHSRFIAPDRAEMEQLLLENLGKPDEKTHRPNRCIVVGTQVIEQSLDLDFDILITELCPMDLLLQRIGRLHRHDRQRPAKFSEAECIILFDRDKPYSDGSKAVYGEYLLMRTYAFLPERITLPSDIPLLVQDVYDDSVPPPKPLPDGYEKAKEEAETLVMGKENRANAFRITRPQTSIRAGLANWLNTSVSNSQKQAEATVRDGDETIEVLVIYRDAKGILRFLPWIDAETVLLPHVTPENDTAQKLAQQCIRLPAALCYRISMTIEQLESDTFEHLKAWQASRWLNGELFLILDENLCARLCGYCLSYDRASGLHYKKEDEAHER